MTQASPCIWLVDLVEKVPSVRARRGHLPPQYFPLGGNLSKIRSSCERTCHTKAETQHLSPSKTSPQSQAPIRFLRQRWSCLYLQAENEIHQDPSTQPETPRPQGFSKGPANEKSAPKAWWPHRLLLPLPDSSTPQGQTGSPLGVEEELLEVTLNKSRRRMG